MVGSLWTGISGLAGQQTALDNESNNIANVNTVGYKSSRISFADQMYQNKIGKGTQVIDAEKLFTQGNLKLTGVSYDVALSGDGFFAVQKPSIGGTSETYFTRAGNFRMGDIGTLQDSLGNEVIGWAMGSEPTTTSTDPNVSKFNNDYTKLLSSNIITYSNAIETITAKATDYTDTAQSDDESVFSGWGLKSKYAKIADVEALITAYSSALSDLKADPNSSSAEAKPQLSYIDLPGGTPGAGNELNSTMTWDNGVVSQDGHEVYIYIDGNRISQSFISKSGTDLNGDGDWGDAGEITREAEGYIATMKAFADKISELPGLKAYVAVPVANANGGTDYVPSTDNIDVINGVLRVESIVPGETFTISSVGMVSDGGSDKPGVYEVLTEATEGQGIARVNEIQKALSEAITGKQTDVYLPSDLGIDGTTPTDFTYQMKIYSNSLEEYVTVPEEGQYLRLQNVETIDDIVNAINGQAMVNGTSDIVNTDGTVGTASNNFESYITAYNINGNLVIKTDENFDVEYSGEMLDGIVPNTATEIKRSADFSGREGAGAEFLELKTRIDQTSSKDSLQLRLDKLNISENAFGDFSVDDTGLITMSQDGAMFAVGQIAIARFITNRGLEPAGNNLLSSTLASGDPIYNINNDKAAEVQANTLELSTADLSESLVNLMVFQRAFEANAKSITTADTILNTLIQLKR
jgi:flagellar hook protein FlgE